MSKSSMNTASIRMASGLVVGLSKTSSSAMLR